MEYHGLQVCQSQSWALQKQLNWLRWRLGCELRWAQGSMYWMRCTNCTLQPPGEYNQTIHVWWRCGLISNYFNHLFGLPAISWEKGHHAPCTTSLMPVPISVIWQNWPLSTYLFLLGIMPSPWSVPLPTSLRACHHSSSLALVTCRMSPCLKLRPRPGRPLSRAGSYSNSALFHSTPYVTILIQYQHSFHLLCL